MTNKHPPPERLAEMPLWRLLVLLADIEREVGASSPTARVITRLIRDRLRHTTESSAADGRKAVSRG
jgi:hypothetical protein